MKKGYFMTMFNIKGSRIMSLKPCIWPVKWRFIEQNVRSVYGGITVIWFLVLLQLVQKKKNFYENAVHSSMGETCFYISGQSHLPQETSKKRY